VEDRPDCITDRCDPRPIPQKRAGPESGPALLATANNLMLSLLDSMNKFLIFAEPQKPANLLAQFSKVLKLAKCEL
jgi:hypothetical protein